MPRKMAGIATITIEASIVAIVMLSVVLDSASHLYRSGRPPFGRDPPDAPFRCPESTLCRTLTQSTAEHLLNGNYLSGGLTWRVLRPLARRRRRRPRQRKSEGYVRICSTRRLARSARTRR